MSTTTLRHARQRPTLAAKMAPIVASRTNLVAGGAILSLPAMATSLVTASPAVADPGTGSATAPGSSTTTSPSTDSSGSAGASSSSSSSSGSTTASAPTLRYGSTGAAVKVLQQRVGGLNVDGIFGPLTLSSVKAYQSSHGLVVDGIVGQLTWASLGGYSGASTGTTTTTPAQPSPSCTVTTVRYGATGDIVQALQQRIGVTADGVFGPATLAAVKSFQSSNGLSVTGAADSATWSALGGYPCITTTGTTTTTNPGTGTGTGSGTTTSYDAKIAQVVAYAKQYLGVPYLWGGSSPAGFDCSGLTSYVYNNLGLSIPRTASQQQRALTPTTDPVPGDLVFFGSPAYHVGIYVSPGVMLDSPHPGASVRLQAWWTTPTSYGHFTG